MKKERVNIQYSIDWEELPTEVYRLLTRANEIYSGELKMAASELAEIDKKTALSLDTLSAIDVTRKKLAAMDYALNDVADIVNGYLHFKVQTTLQEREDTQLAPPGPMPQPPRIEQEAESGET
tara:strand:- start:94 stop:462 length:369 start_codon:yes stop_codon:yes gene_type:complete